MIKTTNADGVTHIIMVTRYKIRKRIATDVCPVGRGSHSCLLRSRPVSQKKKKFPTPLVHPSQRGCPFSGHSSVRPDAPTSPPSPSRRRAVPFPPPHLTPSPVNYGQASRRWRIAGGPRRCGTGELHASLPTSAPASSSATTSVHSSKQQGNIVLKSHLASVYFKCFRCFKGMLQVFHIDVAKVDRDVAYIAYVASVSEVCCKRFI